MNGVLGYSWEGNKPVLTRETPSTFFVLFRNVLPQSTRNSPTGKKFNSYLTHMRIPLDFSTETFVLMCKDKEPS